MLILDIILTYVNNFFITLLKICFFFKLFIINYVPIVFNFLNELFIFVESIFVIFILIYFKIIKLFIRNFLNSILIKNENHINILMTFKTLLKKIKKIHLYK